MLLEISDHCLKEAVQTPSPNCDARAGQGGAERAGRQKGPYNDDRHGAQAVSLIVIHNITLPASHFGGQFVDELFCNRLAIDSHPDFVELVELKVSAHLLIRRGGELVQFVPFHRRAWHAGLSSYNGEENCNDFSIGIELEGTDNYPYNPVQYRVLCSVCRSLIEEYENLNYDNIVGHSDIAPGRKTDPGPSFDWDLFRRLLRDS